MGVGSSGGRSPGGTLAMSVYRSYSETIKAMIIVSEHARYRTMIAAYELWRLPVEPVSQNEKSRNSTFARQNW